MVYDGVYGADRRHERDRIQWSDTFKQKFDVIANGTGEGLIEGVYFGAAYDKPPLFEFSATRKGVAEFDEFRQGVWAHPNQLVSQPQQYPNTVASNIHAGWFTDGGFEVQGQWDSTIPDYSTSRSDYGEWQVIRDTIYGSNPSNYPADNGYELQGGNSWVQEPKNPRWTVTNERPHPDTPIGPKSRYSAKYTFASDSDVSPRLVPFCGPATYGLWNIPVSDTVQHYGIVSHLFPINYATSPDSPQGFGSWYGGGGWSYSWFPNPTISSFEYEAFVYSDEPFTFEAETWVSDQDPPFYSDNYEGVPEGFDEDVWGYGPYIVEAHVLESFDIEPGKWNKLRWKVAVPTRLLPGFPIPRWSNGAIPWQTNATRWATLNFRAKNGVAGQDVFFDDLEGWYRYEPWDDPFITVGVARWIRDEAGAYVGADLWVKVSTSIVGDCE